MQYPGKFCFLKISELLIKNSNSLLHSGIFPDVKTFAFKNEKKKANSESLISEFVKIFKTEDTKLHLVIFNKAL